MSDLPRGARPAPPRLDDWLARDWDDAELLTHNPSNAVTGGIWRVRRGDDTSIVKVVTDGSHRDGPVGWAASHDPTHFNFWRREVEAYTADVAQWFRPWEIDAPALLSVEEPDDRTAVLWLEDVDGRSGAAVEPADIVTLCRRLGSAQATLAAGGPLDHVLDAPWLSRRFLAIYSETKYTPEDLEAVLADDDAWAHPLVARHLGPLREDLARLHRTRERLYDLAAACPQTLCHLDLWPLNLVVRPTGVVTLVDWAFCGLGAMGEDVSNLVPDAFFDLLLPHELLGDLARDAERAYVDGAHAGGWDGDDRWLALGMRAPAAKYHWIMRRLVAAPDDPAIVYGGREVEPEELYAARAACMALLTRWADEALSLASALDA